MDELKAAEAWWKEAMEAIRDERFAPIAERAIAIWQQLRLQSNVDLGGVELAGTTTNRRVTLKVTVDGAPAEALGVMSQGELHSLALSLFLPRATLAANRGRPPITCPWSRIPRSRRFPLNTVVATSSTPSFARSWRRMRAAGFDWPTLAV